MSSPFTSGLPRNKADEKELELWLSRTEWLQFEKLRKKRPDLTLGFLRWKHWFVEEKINAFVTEYRESVFTDRRKRQSLERRIESYLATLGAMERLMAEMEALARLIVEIDNEGGSDKRPL